MVECQLPKLNVVGSNPISRSRKASSLLVLATVRRRRRRERRSGCGRGEVPAFPAGAIPAPPRSLSDPLRKLRRQERQPPRRPLQAKRLVSAVLPALYLRLQPPLPRPPSGATSWFLPAQPWPVPLPLRVPPLSRSRGVGDERRDLFIEGLVASEHHQQLPDRIGGLELDASRTFSRLETQRLLSQAAAILQPRIDRSGHQAGRRDGTTNRAAQLAGICRTDYRFRARSAWRAPRGTASSRNRTTLQTGGATSERAGVATAGRSVSRLR